MSQTTPSMMGALFASSMLDGANAAYLESIYEAYLKDPTAVDPAWKQYFEDLPTVDGKSQEVLHSNIREQFVDLVTKPQLNVSTAQNVTHERNERRVQRLIESYRLLGHLCSHIDPLQVNAPDLISELSLEYHNLDRVSADEHFKAGYFAEEKTIPLSKLLQALKSTYCGKIGVEFLHLSNYEEREWLKKRLESIHGVAKFSSEKKQHIFKRIVASEGMEKYLGAKFPGAKRFSLEGGEALIPLLDELIQRSGSQGIKEIVIGMAHRGRLNVLVNTLGKNPSELFDEFSGKHEHFEDLASGDVKYHQGFSSDVVTPGGVVHLALAFNPSHLEIVTPVVAGSVRARQDRRKDKSHETVLPIIMHGDAAFAGQGVVMETLNMAQTPGYRVGGTVHLVINNHIGFTTSNVAESRSTMYCTDVAKMVQAPIFHVNGDDPEALVLAGQIALDFRATFHKDVVIDISCYRRHGHNEADEPAATQPIMYKKIRKHPTLIKRYGEQLVNQNIIQAEDIGNFAREYRDVLDAGKSVANQVVYDVTPEFAVDWKPYLKQDWLADFEPKFDRKTFLALGKNVITVPDGFKMHPRVTRIFESRAKMLSQEIPFDWGMAELMAYATLIHQGFPVRISGQDCCRGTFFHRHANVHEQNTGEIFVPLRNVSQNQPDFLVINSLLSEEAVLGFEYGYSTTEPRTLLIWEAQFGDFANGAQVVIDQFISSGQQKWGRLSHLVMFLPHGYEGQGPEHSSARLERYLQLCAEHNIQVCVPTTPAQVYHMIRRQMLRPLRSPLIVMTPKSLLRHKQAISSIDELVDGKFKVVIDEIDSSIKQNSVKKVVLCSGKVFYDLYEERNKRKINDVALIRLEQLYPFPEAALGKVLEYYKHVNDIVWCQEEPQNQGAWYSSQHHIRNILLKGQSLHYSGREPSASTAAGYASLHKKEQDALIEKTLTFPVTKL